MEPSLDLSDRTQTGIHPYRVGENPFPCPLGHTFGYRQLSPLVLMSKPDSFDFALTRQWWGTHGDSYFWPTRELLLNRPLGELFLAKTIKYLDIVPVYNEDGKIL